MLHVDVFVQEDAGTFLETLWRFGGIVTHGGATAATAVHLRMTVQVVN